MAFRVIAVIFATAIVILSFEHQSHYLASTIVHLTAIVSRRVAVIAEWYKPNKYYYHCYSSLF